MSKEQTGRVIRLFFVAMTLSLFMAAAAAPDRGSSLTGLLAIWSAPTQLTTDFFALGGISATMLSMGLTMALCTALTFLPGATVKGSTMAAFLLTLGFSSWGIHLVNILPFLLGTCVYAAIKRQPLGNFVDIAMFSTALCPLASDLMLRYPGDTVHGFTLTGIALALVVGIAVGILTPPLAAHSPAVHKGFNLYSAALPAGLLGFFLNALLYKTLGYTTPEIGSILHEGGPVFVRTFCIAVFVLCILAGFLLNGRSFRGYAALLRDTGHKANFVDSYGIGCTILNIGVYGLFITAYYVVTNAPCTGVTLGITFCMVCFGAAGSHPLNVWPIMVGYAVASLFGTNPLSAQGAAVGLCYASGLAPIAGVYGWPFGVVAGIAHYCLVTSVPALHGGFCLYNGGFTSILIATLMVPQLESFFRTRAERKAGKASAAQER